ncbi:cornifelin-like [Chanos chanos]|uniref:Cornifelin-like n=1 Tax=Chanos chanos TaxID=29144 RepID=A0A6J2VTS1_CHACN|nr:cornifelin-like [Chanos chanos]
MPNSSVMQQPQNTVINTFSNQWSTGICDCFDNIPECCYAFWCMPCYACMISEKHGECLCLPLLDGFGLFPPATMAMRVRMRYLYGIEGSICNDCVYSLFCCACVWCQMSRERQIREEGVTLVSQRQTNLTARGKKPLRRLVEGARMLRDLPPESRTVKRMRERMGGGWDPPRC